MADLDNSWYTSVVEAHQDFDLNKPLTEEELEAIGMGELVPPGRLSDSPIVKDLEDVDDDGDSDLIVATGDDYNRQYLHFLSCQNIAALAAFEEGWQSFNELILKAYIKKCRRENKEYRGDDPNKAFSLRLREQAAEDFVQFIHAMVNEAAATPKPVLKK